MEETIKNKMLFVIHLDQAMSYMESFYRENLQAIRERMDAQASLVSDRKERRKLQRDNDIAYERSVKQIETFKKNNYKFLDMMEANLPEDKLDRLEEICIGVGKVVELLTTSESSNDINLLIGLYNQGLLKDFLEKVKENLDEQRKDTSD